MRGEDGSERCWDALHQPSTTSSQNYNCTSAQAQHTLRGGTKNPAVSGECHGAVALSYSSCALLEKPSASSDLLFSYYSGGGRSILLPPNSRRSGVGQKPGGIRGTRRRNRGRGPCVPTPPCPATHLMRFCRPCLLEFRRSTALLMVPSPAAGCRLPQPLPARTAARRRASPRPVFRKFCIWFPFVSASPPCSTPSCLLHLHLLLLCSLQTSGRAPGAALDEGWVLPASTVQSRSSSGCYALLSHLSFIFSISSPSLLRLFPSSSPPPHPTPSLSFFFLHSFGFSSLHRCFFYDKNEEQSKPRAAARAGSLCSSSQQ